MKTKQQRRDEWAMDMAQIIAEKSSKDPSTKTGAIILDQVGSIIAVGYNSLPHGVADSPGRRDRPTKYKFTEHAERNAIYSAASNGTSLKGSTMYIMWYPCADCARAIIQSGIATLVCYEPDWENIKQDDKWTAHFNAAKQMLTESDVEVRFLDKEEL